MCTARSSSHLGGSPYPPGSRPTWEQTPLGSRHPPMGADPPGAGTPQNRHPPEQAPPRADTTLWTETLAHATENITLPQTSFASGN